MTDTDTIARLTADLAGERNLSTAYKSMLAQAENDLTQALARAEKAERDRDAALAGAVEVRPLQFADDHGDGVLTSRETGELFRVFPQSSGKFFAPKLGTELFATAEAAVARFNSWHKARTLAALHPSPDALQAVTAAALEEVAQWHLLRARIAMESLSCGSENRDFREAHQLSDFHKAAAKSVRELRPDALAAQTRRDAQMQAKGMRAAADQIDAPRYIATEYAMAQWDAKRAILALAAQTEEAANG